MGPVCWCCSKWLWTHTLVWLYSHIDTPPKWHHEQTHIAPEMWTKTADQRHAVVNISLIEIQTNLWPLWADRGLVSSLRVTPRGTDTSGTKDAFTPLSLTHVIFLVLSRVRSLFISLSLIYPHTCLCVCCLSAFQSASPLYLSLSLFVECLLLPLKWEESLKSITEMSSPGHYLL